MISVCRTFFIELKKQRPESVSLHSSFLLECLKQRMLQPYGLFPWWCGSASLPVGEMSAAQPGCWGTALQERTRKLCSCLPHCSPSKAWCLGIGAVQKVLNQQRGAAQNWPVGWCGFSQATGTTACTLGQMALVEKGAGRGGEERSANAFLATAGSKRLCISTAQGWETAPCQRPGPPSPSSPSPLA